MDNSKVHQAGGNVTCQSSQLHGGLGHGYKVGRCLKNITLKQKVLEV
jgi:hypothetical protein